MRIKSVGIGSSAKISGAMYALMGLILGAVFALMSLVSQGMWASESPLLGMMFGVGAIVFLPVFYGTIGLVAGAIGAALYNWVAGMIGGLELELE